ncbi:MAG: M15 family metallopeptidase [Acinetobacter amyesii]|uniref:M15 family metallopeptidase n=1 Tax=Acinetobacter TaxID=469 RepID=UPI0015D463AE|nr:MULTISPECIES: M15 family metallopeptidase [unclassified Acinetobacter]
MIIFLVSCFFVLALVTVLCFSYELRIKVQDFFFQIIPQSKKRIQHAKNFAYELNYAAAPQQIQSHWHLQQWWILFAGFLLFASILLFAFTRPITASKVEADYLRKVDPQIYAMLDGQVLDAPPEVEEYLVQEAIAEEAAMIEQPSVMASSFNPEVQDIHTHSYSTDIPSADRKWHKMNPRYKQRLLMVFKIMREQHGYEMVLLEGYRSPERQNNLATNKNTTRARGFQSYHQFGLAADVAFKRNGKVVITERDPWAMRGYQLYGQAAESVGLTWGGRWKSIQDYGHTEYRMPGLKKTAEMAALLTSEGQLQANNISIE